MPRGPGGAASPSSPDEFKASLPQLLRPRSLPLPPDPDRPPADRPRSFHFLPHTLISPRTSLPQVQQQPSSPPPLSKLLIAACLPDVRVPIPRNLPPGPWETLEMSTSLLPQQRNPQVPGSTPEDAGEQNAPQDNNFRGNRWRHHQDETIANQDQKYDNRWHSGFGEGEERSAAYRRAGYDHGGPFEYAPMQNTYQNGYEYEKKHMKRGDFRYSTNRQPNVNWQKGPQCSAEKQKGKVERLAVKQKLQVGGGNQQEFDVHKPVHDLVAEDFGGGNSSDEKRDEIEIFSSEGDASSEDASPEKQANSLADKDDHAQSKVKRDSQTLMLEHVGSNSLEREQSSSCHMRNRTCIECRPDLETFTPKFIALYKSLIPDGDERDKQNQLLQSLRKSVNNEWPNAKLHLYGSCANSFGFSNSDIDICLEIENSNMSKHDMLLKLADLLMLENFQDVKAITSARVPIVKMTDPKTGISCDICINNLLAVINTKLLRDYSLIDDRLHQLVFIVKHWARNRKLNETYHGTLSSYAYALMCINFLQLRRPAILPCLQNMEATFELSVEDTDCTYFNQVDKIRNFGAQNKESIAQLVWGFFEYWAYYHDYRNDVISVRTGTIISKQMKNWTTRVGNDRHLLCIEDPFDTSHDLGRVVSCYSIRILREEFERAADILHHDPNPCVTLVEQHKPSPTRNLP